MITEDFLKKPLIEESVSLINRLSADDHTEKWEKGLRTAQELAKICAEDNSIATALLYPFYQSTNQKTIAEKSTPEINHLLKGVLRMKLIDTLTPDTHEQTDKMRRMLLAIVDDARIVVIKLAERLAELKQLSQAETPQQQKLAQQISAIYAPLANRLGIWQLKWQLEDWTFRYLHPESYKTISKALKKRRIEREHYIQSVQTELETLLTNANIENFQLTGRAKHIYSIHRKLEKKQIPFEQLYDANAFRIIVDSIQNCYEVLGMIHERWRHIEAEFDDYIARPKSNGYQSIHTVVIGPEQHAIEIQIRTRTMHEDAELGVAAHWKYKEGEKSADKYEDKIHLLRDIMNWQQDITANTARYKDLFADRVYAFTPNNDVLDLPIGATPLDAAYYIHTEIGHCCRGAKINGKIVTLSTPVKTGDVIEVLTRKNSTPSQDWLNINRGYVKTKRARDKIRSFFHQQQEEKEVATPTSRTVAKPMELTPKTAPKGSKSTTLTIQGTNNLLTQVAQCCQPSAEDKVIGYITRGRGISIHREDCQNLINAKQLKPERVIQVAWEHRDIYS